MVVKLNLPPHIERAYVAEAAARSLRVTESMEEEALVSARQTNGEPARLSQAEWLLELEAWRQRNAGKNLPMSRDRPRKTT